MRTASRFIVKPGELFGTFHGSEWGKAVRKVVTETDDSMAGACMLGGTLARNVPAVHVSGLGMYGEKFPFSRVRHHGTVRTQRVDEKKPDTIEVCVLLRPDWATLRYGTPKGECYDEQPTWIEFQPVEHVVSLRGIYNQWYARGRNGFSAEDVAHWLAEIHGREYLKEKPHQRAVRLLLEGECDVSNAESTMIPYMKLTRASRWRYIWTVEWCEHGNKHAAKLAAERCGWMEETTP